MGLSFIWARPIGCPTRQPPLNWKFGTVELRATPRGTKPLPVPPTSQHSSPFSLALLLNAQSTSFCQSKMRTRNQSRRLHQSTGMFRNLAQSHFTKYTQTRFIFLSSLLGNYFFPKPIFHLETFY